MAYVQTAQLRSERAGTVHNTQAQLKFCKGSQESWWLASHCHTVRWGPKLGTKKSYRSTSHGQLLIPGASGPAGPLTTTPSSISPHSLKMGMGSPPSALPSHEPGVRLKSGPRSLFLKEEAYGRSPWQGLRWNCGRVSLGIAWGRGKVQSFRALSRHATPPGHSDVFTSPEALQTSLPRACMFQSPASLFALLRGQPRSPAGFSLHLPGVRLILTNAGTPFHMGCANQEALSVPFVLLCPSARWMRPEGVTNPGEKKPSKEDVPTQKGGQRGPSGPGETALAPAHLSPYRWALTARDPEPELSLWMNLEAPSQRNLQPGMFSANQLLGRALEARALTERTQTDMPRRKTVRRDTGRTGVYICKSGNTKTASEPNHHQSGQRHRTESPLQPPEGTCPANTLISDF
ncbi:hypothetical protein Cadr_000019682 [Camelus dromedarius]|uniref:Uncharacterized protein n=1 Tax=Camelus dromedarius TaxID=9838 RepID=A0A5N4D4Q3_CAMDR|nr:hypothetical protein Cadr_000019682 [Camelus dromedarius]